MMLVEQTQLGQQAAQQTEGMRHGMGGMELNAEGENGGCPCQCKYLPARTTIQA